MSVLSMRGGANAWPAAARIRRFVVSRAERRRRSFMQVRGWISGKRPYGNKSIWNCLLKLPRPNLMCCITELLLNLKGNKRRYWKPCWIFLLIWQEKNSRFVLVANCSSIWTDNACYRSRTQCCVRFHSWSVGDSGDGWKFRIPSCPVNRLPYFDS